MNLNRLHKEVEKTDNLFTAALVRAYGQRAPLMRYCFSEHPPEVQQARSVRYAAIRAFLDAMELKSNGPQSRTKGQ